MKSIVGDRVVGNNPTPKSKRHIATSSAATTTTGKSNPTSSNIGVVNQLIDFPNRHYVNECNLFLMILNHNISSGDEAQIWRCYFLYSRI